MLTLEIALIAHAIFALSLREYLAVSLRLDHQPLFGKGARAPPGGTRTRHELESGGNRAYVSLRLRFKSRKQLTESDVRCILSYKL